jgi:predicted TIM-barrel fold metal-dependent hydrolase
MFETDFPHPTCLYPSPLERAAAVLGDFTDAERRKIFSGNAAKLYRIPVS